MMVSVGIDQAAAQRLAEAYRGKAVSFPKVALAAPPVEQTMDGTWRWLLDYLGWKATKARA